MRHSVGLFCSMMGVVAMAAALVELMRFNRTTHQHGSPEQSPSPAESSPAQAPAFLLAGPARPPVEKPIGGASIGLVRIPYEHAAVEYDRRPFRQMAEAWEKESDDPEWSTNVQTFIEAMIETLDDRPDAQRLDALSVRCKTSVCRIDASALGMQTLIGLLQESSAQQPHVMYEPYLGDAGVQIQAYLGRERGAPGEP